MDREYLEAVVGETAGRFDISVHLISAIIDCESSWDTWAFNPEPHYRYFWDVRARAPFRSVTAAEIASESPPEDFFSPSGVPRDAEWQAQQASWGLMQVMGGTARWMGMRNPWLTQLLEPGLGVEFGCRYLRHQLDRNGGEEPKAVAAYNAGAALLVAGGHEFRNQAYVDKVFRRYARRRADSS